jgi:O-antigen/teichoic acid export membrane protein
MLQNLKSVFLQNQNIKQKMFKNIFWLSASQISRLLRMFTLLYAARVLGASEYGIFAYILGTVGIFSIFTDMGINPLLTRDVAGESQKQEEYFATSFWIKTALIGLTSIIFIIFMPYATKIQTTINLLPLAMLLIVSDNIRDFIIAYLRGLEKMERETLITTVLNIALAIAGFTTLIFYPTAEYFFFTYVCSSFFATLLALIVARNIIFHIFSGFRKKIAVDIFKNGWPIALSGMFSILMLNIDIFMLGLWSTTTQIGLYAASQKITQVLYTIPTILSLGIFPTIASVVKTNNHKLEKSLNEKSISFILIFTIPLVIGGIILAKPIFEFVFGPEYIEGVIAFRLLLFSILFVFPGILINSLVLAHNQQQKMFKFVISATVINISLNALLIPKVGITGAAFATLLAQIVNYGCAWYQMKKIINFEILPYVKNMLLAATIMGTGSYVFYQLNIHILVNIALSATLYLVLLWYFKERILTEMQVFVNSLKG